MKHPSTTKPPTQTTQKEAERRLFLKGLVVAFLCLVLPPNIQKGIPDFRASSLKRLTRPGARGIFLFFGSPLLQGAKGVVVQSGELTQRSRIEHVL